MSSGESTNVLANAVGRIDFWVKQPQLDFPNTYPLDGDLSAGLCYPTFEQLEPMLLGHASWTCIKKTNNNNTKNAKKTRKQEFKDKCVFHLLAIQPFVAAISYIVGEGNIVIVSRFVVTNLSRSKCIECIMHTMCH